MNPIDYLKEWITTDLSCPQSTLNNLSACPFAKIALDENRIEFLYTTTTTFPPSIDVDDTDAVVFIFEDTICPQTLNNLANNFNEKNPLLIALDDHPLEPEVVNGVVFNNKKYPIIIVQPRAKLEHYRKILEIRGYYKQWPAVYLEELLKI